MSTHNIYNNIFARLSSNGCRDITCEELSSLANDTLRNILHKNPHQCDEIEEMIYSIIYHDAIIYQNLTRDSKKHPYMANQPRGKNKIDFDCVNLPMHLRQILFTFFNDLISTNTNQ